MAKAPSSSQPYNWPVLAQMPAPAKALATMVIVIMSIAMAGALAQIIVHDIIPTFFAAGRNHGGAMSAAPATVAPPEAAARGDLFSDTPAAGQQGSHRGDLLGELPAAGTGRPAMLMDDKQFVWLLKWTHIHLFGMSMIFMFMGAVSVFLDTSARTRVWLVVLPFVGVLVDIGAMWLKTYVSPAFFWLHIPGGGLFGAVFVWVALASLMQMWLPRARKRPSGPEENAP